MTIDIEEIWYDKRFGTDTDITVSPTEIDFNFNTFYIKVNGVMLALTASEYATIKIVDTDIDMNENNFYNFVKKQEV